MPSTQSEPSTLVPDYQEIVKDNDAINPLRALHLCKQSTRGPPPHITSCSTPPKWPSNPNCTDLMCMLIVRQITTFHFHRLHNSALAHASISACQGSTPKGVQPEIDFVAASLLCFHLDQFRGHTTPKPFLTSISTCLVSCRVWSMFAVDITEEDDLEDVESARIWLGLLKPTKVAQTGLRGSMIPATSLRK